MKIAIPSNDNETIFPHFGRTRGFVIAEIENNQVISKEFITNSFTHHHNHHHDHHHNHHDNHYHHDHSHQPILDALNDCEVVIARGMGRFLYEDLINANKKIFVTKVKNIDDALNEYLKGSLDNDPENCCEH